MATSVVFNGVTYSIPAAGEVAWASLSNFLIAVANYAQVIGKQTNAIRTATGNTVTVNATTDFSVICIPEFGGAVDVTLPVGVNGQIFCIAGGTGDEPSSPITVSGTGQNISGGTTYVINSAFGAAAFQFSAAENSWAVINEALRVVPIERGGTSANSAANARSNLGLGTIATQDANAVAITGGSITGITDLAIADGGTGASTAGDARTNLGLGTIATQNAASVAITGGTITGITDLAVADGGTGASDASGARTNLGLGTLSTQDANNVNITGGAITGITDLAIADGGTGQSSKTAAYDALSPTTTKGDLISRDGTNNIRVAVGADGTVLTANSANASGLGWSAPLTNPMDSAGDLIVGGALGAATKLDSGAANTVLQANGAAAPTWVSIVNANISGAAGIDGSKIQAASASNTGTVSREESATISGTGVTGGGTGGSCNAIAYRVGNTVTITGIVTIGTGSPANQVDSTGSFAANFRPANDVRCIARIDSTNTTTVEFLVRSSGILTWIGYSSALALKAFPVSTSYRTTMSFVVGNP